MRCVLFIFICSSLIASDAFDQEKYGAMYVNGKMVRSGPSSSGNSFWNQEVSIDRTGATGGDTGVSGSSGVVGGSKETGKITKITGSATVNPLQWRCAWVYRDAKAKTYTFETVEGMFFTDIAESEISKIEGPVLSEMPKVDKSKVVLHCKDGRCTVQK